MSRTPFDKAQVGARAFAPGEVFDGEALPPNHPLFVRADEPPTVTVHNDKGAPAAALQPAALSIRRFCAWGRPGRLPYQGTAEEALRAAGLPSEVRAQLVAAIHSGQPVERLVIDNHAIRATQSGRLFAADDVAMTYGRTLCLGTRVNFVPGHTESASLYEATDGRGRRYSVMVPEVCGNVSVINATGGADAAIPARTSNPWDAGAPLFHVTHLVMADAPHRVPGPGTLSITLLALAAAGAATRRRWPDPSRPPPPAEEDTPPPASR